MGVTCVAYSFLSFPAGAKNLPANGERGETDSWLSLRNDKVWGIKVRSESPITNHWRCF